MNRNRRHPPRILSILATAMVVLSCASAFAQDAPAAAKPAPAKPVFKEEELAALLAPIALYPDTVVAQILMASTYPLEVVSANRWVQKNTSLKGEALAKEAKKQPWAEPVQAMTAFPDLLKQMDEKLEWTQKLGDAYLAQPKDVMAMVQVLRNKAKAEGNLKSDDKMKVSVDSTPPPADATAASTQSTTTVVAPPTQTIVIESSDPEVIYVPAYNPTVIYGSWGYPAYPPYYWPPPYGYPAYGYGAGFFWGAAVGISIGYWGGGWNNHCDWHGGDININGDVNIGSGNRNNIGSGNRGQGSPKGSTFQHDPSHRQGVSYRDQGTASKYNKGGSSRASTRDAAGGRAGGATAGTRDLGGASAGTRDLGGAGAGTRDLSGGSGGGVRDLGGSGASAGTRDLGASGGNLGSSGTRNLGSTPSAGTRDVGSSSRGSYGGSSSSRGSSSAFSGSSSGRSASSYGSRGGMSRGGGGGGGRRR